MSEKVSQEQRQQMVRNWAILISLEATVRTLETSNTVTHEESAAEVVTEIVARVDELMEEHGGNPASFHQHLFDQMKQLEEDKKTEQEHQDEENSDVLVGSGQTLPTGPVQEPDPDDDIPF